jgi:predicted dehydrogenase
MTVRVGLIGCGGIANAHVREYYASQPAEARLVACADPDPAMRQRMSDTYGIPVHADTAELLARSDIDVVDICTPPTLHPRLIRAAAEAGKHALSEKPLALDFDEASDAIARATELGVQVGVMQNYRYRPEYIEARNAVVGGRIGTPFMASLQALLHWYGGAEYRRAAEKMLMLEVGYHYVDLLRFMLNADVTKVYAVAGRPDTTPIAGDTYSAMILHFDNGAVGNIVNSGECQGARTNWGGEAVVQGSGGTVYVNHRQHNTFGMYSTGSGGFAERTWPTELYGLSTNISFGTPLGAYFAMFDKRGVFPVSGADNLNTLGAIVAAYASAESGQPVQVVAGAGASRTLVGAR